MRQLYIHHFAIHSASSKAVHGLPILEDQVLHCLCTFTPSLQSNQPAVAAASAPGVAATAPVAEEEGAEPASRTAGLVLHVWMTNWPVDVVPPVPETLPADPPGGFEA